MNRGYISVDLDKFWRLSIMYVLSFFLFLLNLIQIPFFYISDVRIYFVAVVIYFWAVYLPSFLKPYFLFFIGIIYDLLLGFPIGLHSLLFILSHFFILRQRLFLMGQTFIMNWIGFIIFCSLFIFAEWLLFSFYLTQILSISNLVIGVMLSAILFPLIAIPFQYLLKVLIAPLRITQ